MYVFLQAQLPVSKGEQAALGQLVAWLGTFASTGLSRDSTAMEALDDPLTPSPSGLRGLSSRELSGLDAAVAAAVAANSQELRVSRSSLEWQIRWPLHMLSSTHLHNCDGRCSDC